MTESDLLKFDFGFTAVDESELEAFKTIKSEATSASAEVDALEEKVSRLYNAILPLLTNLKKDPDKDYILWPNRTEKIDAFEDHIRKIIE
jgi:hypothetical protein|tara:strand:+ start:226 stop:495 length:270 start_codon:yes stop_codon:yes gene_type:complete